MLREYLELWLAFFSAIALTLVYLFVSITMESIPPASGLFGHTLGILGFLLMLMTESLYSLRKRSRSARWGRTSSWLQFHIYTGLVGPYMVLLHTSWKFNGLAGLLLLLTMVIVTSGFVGRYIYTAVPRTAEGVVIDAQELNRQIAGVQRELDRLVVNRAELARFSSLSKGENASTGNASAFTPTGISLVMGRSLADGMDHLRWQREKRRLRSLTRDQLTQLERLIKRRRKLDRQLASLASVRRLLALWHTIHVPVGVALFAAALVHILAAIYYGMQTAVVLGG
ncbi:MAG: hypothetical protein EHM70_21635 [Chloroflexota bacterium]|nr:MAG: hypothetical protein EHM70_21635 [Chloroflexota bacterium]